MDMRAMQLMAAGVLCFLMNGDARAFSPIEKPAEKQTEMSTAKELNTDDLREMMEKMGYELTVTESADGKTKWIRVKMTRSELGGSFNVCLALSPSNTKLWAHVGVAAFNTEHEGNAVRLLKLLERNEDVGPVHFRYSVKQKQLFMSSAIDTRGLTPALVREQIEGLLDKCVETKDDWNTNKWGEAKTAKKD